MIVSFLDRNSDGDFYNAFYFSDDADAQASEGIIKVSDRSTHLVIPITRLVSITASLDPS